MFYIFINKFTLWTLGTNLNFSCGRDFCDPHILHVGCAMGLSVWETNVVNKKHNESMLA